LNLYFALKGHNYRKPCKQNIELPVPGSFKCISCKYFELHTCRFYEMLQPYYCVLCQIYRIWLCDE